MADKILDSIENLDKILANINNSNKERIIEQMAKKFGLIENEQID